MRVELPPARCARSSAAERRSGVWRGRIARASRTGPAGRPMQQRAEQLDRGRVGPVEVVEHEHERLGRRRAARAARAPRGGCDSARAGGATSRPAASAGQRREDRAPARREHRHPRVSNRRGASPSTYSSSASTKTQKGRSRSSSDAEPARTSWPWASARATSSVSSRVLPMPGSPTSATSCRAPAVELGDELVERAQLRGAAHELLGPRPFGALQPNLAGARGIAKCEIRVLVQGAARMSARRCDTVRLDACPSYLLQHHHEALECGVVFAAFSGHESPLRHRATLASCSSGGHAIWWTVEASSRRRRAGVPALLRGRAHDCDERHASRHPMTGRSRTMPPEYEPSNNIAARMARWSAHHRKIAIFGWLGCVIARLRDRQFRGRPRS